MGITDRFRNETLTIFVIKRSTKNQAHSVEVLYRQSKMWKLRGRQQGLICCATLPRYLNAISRTAPVPFVKAL